MQVELIEIGKQLSISVKAYTASETAALGLWRSIRIPLFEVSTIGVSERGSPCLAHELGRKWLALFRIRTAHVAACFVHHCTRIHRTSISRMQIIRHVVAIVGLESPASSSSLARL